jgi:hypothetical protein
MKGQQTVVYPPSHTIDSVLGAANNMQATRIFVRDVQCR